MTSYIQEYLSLSIKSHYFLIFILPTNGDCKKTISTILEMLDMNWTIKGRKFQRRHLKMLINERRTYGRLLIYSGELKYNVLFISNPASYEKIKEWEIPGHVLARAYHGQILALCFNKVVVKYKIQSTQRLVWFAS